LDIKIGTAPDSWGVWFPKDEKQINWKVCLDEMAQAGYEGIELGPWGYLPNDYKTLKHEIDSRNLKLVATTLVGDLMSVEKTEIMIEKLHEMAVLQVQFDTAPYVVLIDDCYTDLFTGEIVRPVELNEQQWQQFIENINRIRNVAKESYNLEVVFHPHAQSHIETEAQIERLLKDTDINLCLDTGHHAYCDGDPVAFMKRYHERIPYLHIKSCDMEVKKMMQENNWSFAEAVKRDVMCEPELGVVDMKVFFNVLADIQYKGWLVVEQDMYPAPFDKPFPIAKRTKEYLDSLLSQSMHLSK
jgi:inosose dehydratase